MFNVQVKDSKPKMQSVFLDDEGKQFKEIVTSHHSSQFFWMPFNDHCWVKTFQKTDKPVDKTDSQYIRQTFGNWLAMHFGFLGVDAITKLGPLTPVISSSLESTDTDSCVALSSNFL